MAATLRLKRAAGVPAPRAAAATRARRRYPNWLLEDLNWAELSDKVPEVMAQ